MTALIDITESLCLAVASGNLGEAQAIARDLRLRLPARRAVNPAAIMSAVCRRYYVKASEVRSPDRHRHLSLPRAIAMYLFRELAEWSYSRIGAWFGGRDHTTAIAACQKVRRWIEGDARVADAVGELRGRLTSGRSA